MNPLKKYLNRDKWLHTLTITMLVLGIGCIGYVLLSNFMKKQKTANMGNLDCVKETSTHIIEDEFMSGVVEKKASVKVLNNFYNCNSPAKGDLAWFRFSDQITPVVRFIRGLPGDKYALTVADEKKGLWTISINGEQVKNGSEPYMIYSNSVPPLRTYELSRGGVLLEDEYILLSNVSPGLSDSSNLGLVNKKTLAGKVVLAE